MIKAVFIINNQGKPRLCKFYEYLVRPSPLGLLGWVASRNNSN